MREGAEAERAAARARAEAELTGLTRELSGLRRAISDARRAEARRASEAAAPASPRARERDRGLDAASRAASRAREALREPAPEPVTEGPPPGVGDHVHDPVMGFRGRILAIDGDRAEVQGGSARMRIPLGRLVRDRAAARRAEFTEPPPPVASVSAPAATLEVDVRGQRVEEARGEVRDRMDAAAMAGLPSVRVIHGHGTGALRTVVREELRRHPLVARAEPAPPDQGGDGATIAHLTDD